MPNRNQPKKTASLGALTTLTCAARVWVICDTLGRRATRQNVLAAAERLGVQQRTALNHYNLWRYAHKQEQKAASLPTTTRRRILQVAKQAVA